MHRPLTHPQNQQRLLIASAFLAIALALAPARFTGWLGWFAEVTRNLIAPISHPVAQFSRWISPATGDAAAPERVLALEEERDRYRALYLREADVSRALRRRIAALQQGLALNPDLPYRLETAPVIGTSSEPSGGTITVRLGRPAGVDLSTVATVGGDQIVGRVVRVGARDCQVRPITDKSAGPILARVILTPEGLGAACQLEPDGSGLLKGPVEDLSGDATLGNLSVQEGQTVRLADDAWPANAQMLVVGRVLRVEPSPEHPLRSIVVVEPKATLARVGQVELRIIDRAAADPSAGTGPDGGIGG
ncbi:MAG: rod shape-determining protein MreC [Phycisphaerales bacterium JB037]